MKRFISIGFVILLPVFLIVIMNEYSRQNKEASDYTKYSIHTINNERTADSKCSWICHNSSTYCKQNHAHLLRPYFNYTDPIYFATIDTLKSSGNYVLANILFFVLLMPILTLGLLYNGITIQRKIEEMNIKYRISNHEFRNHINLENERN